MVAKIIVQVWVVVLFLGWGPGLSQAARNSPQEDLMIRVAILKDVPSFKIAVRGQFQFITEPGGEQDQRTRSMKECSVVAIERGLLLDGEKFVADRVRIIPKRDAAVYINGRRFRGEVDILRKNQKGLTVVNVVALEDYIKGVLYHEVSHRWTMEAFKVQAVSTRTYALYRMKENRTPDFDLTDDIYSQVYGGRGSERYRTTLAVERTRGLIVSYHGRILPTYFHAACGGHTENVSELWKENLPPLRGIVCEFCRQSPHNHWKRNFRLKDIQDKLNEKGYDLGLIKEIKVLERNASGRIRRLEILTRDGKVKEITGKDFRNIIGPNVLKSNNYEIIMQGYYMDVVGRGWGHGVGMCQWGANFMARERYKFDEILQFYYPGSQIVDYHELNFLK